MEISNIYLPFLNKAQSSNKYNILINNNEKFKENNYTYCIIQDILHN